MKDRIIKILEKYSSLLSNNDFDGNIIHDHDFEQVAEEIEKLYDTQFLLGSTVKIGTSTSRLFEGEEYKVVTEEINVNNVCKYELVLIDDRIPQKRVWIQREILLKIMDNQ